MKVRRKVNESLKINDWQENSYIPEIKDTS